MQANVATSAGSGSGSLPLDLASDALSRLAQAAILAEGAFRDLVREIGASRPGADTPAGRPDVPLGEDGVDLSGDVVDIVGINVDAAEQSAEVWDGFGLRMVDMFQRVFQQVAEDGELSFAELFSIVAPMITDVLRQFSGIDLSPVLGGIGNVFNSTSSGSGLGIGDFISAGSSIFSLVSGGGGLGGILSGGGALTGAVGALSAAMPYIGAALTIAQIVGPMLFAPSPSVGPTTVARVSPARRDAIYSTDNDGDPDALIDTVDTIFGQIGRFQSRFGGALNGNGFDIGYFPNPEDGSGQTGGYNFKAIIGAHAEDEDRFTGLSEAELVAEAVKFIVREGMDGIDVPEVVEAAKHSAAETIDELFDDLVFAERFGDLRAALDEAGEGIDAYTVALQRQRQEIEETGRTLATDGVAAIRGFLDRVMTLFPGEPYLSETDAEDVNIAGIGTPVPGTDEILLYDRDEGTDHFQPGVTGVYDDLERGLVGLDVQGQRLDFRFDGDEGAPHPILDGEVPADTVALTPEGVSVTEEALRELLGTVDDVGAAANATASYSQEYLDNQERVRDAFAIALADVDALIETIAGGFEPETIGPFEERLIAGNAAIDQLATELNRINEDIADATEVFPELGVAVIDVAAQVQAATDSLRQQLASDFTKEVERELREETGLGARDGIEDAAQEFADRRADGAAIGVTDFSDLEALYRHRVLALLENSDDLAGVLDLLGGSFAELEGVADLLPGALEELRDTFGDGLDRDVREAKGLGVIDVITDRLDAAADRQTVADALGIDAAAGLDVVLRGQITEALGPDSLTPEVIAAVSASFADNALVMEILADALDLNLEAVNDNAAAQITLADVTRLATRELQAQIQEQEELAGTAERAIESLAKTRQRLALDSDLSILSPAEQLAEARAIFEDLSARAAAGDQDAQLELGSAGEDYLRLARDFYASSEDYARIFGQVDAVLRDTESVAQQQLSVALAQLEELRRLTAQLSGDTSGLANPDANFGQYATRNRMIARLTGYSGDFGSGGFNAFRSGLSAEISQAVDFIARTINFANGGIMTSAGPLPLSAYASGGIADSPQLALFGEGRMAEAFVPLPDGRSIPVTVTQPANDGASPLNGEGVADLIDETRRMAAAINAMRADNAALRRGLERVVATTRGSGRAA